MSVTVENVRFAIQDYPRSFGVLPELPRVMGVSDGINTTYYLPLDERQYVAGSAVLYQTPSGGPQTSISTSAYTITQQGLVSLNNALAQGVIVAAQFQASVLADADLTNVIASNTQTYGDPRYVGWGCQLDIIDILLSNPRKLARLREAEYEKDPAAVIAALKELRSSLQNKIESGIRPNRSAPFLFVGGPRIRSYQPGR